MNHRNCRFFALALFAGLPLSCTVPAAHRTYTLNPSYAAKNFSNRKYVVAMPGDGGILINNPTDVTGDFGGLNASPESRIRKFYFPEFARSFKSLVSSDSVVALDEVRPDLSLDSLGTRVITLKTGSDSLPVNYTIPEQSRLQALSLDGSLAVLVERIEFKRNPFSIQYYWDEKSRKLANLQADARVLIWDCRSETPVFYGTLTATVEFQFGLARKHWDESAE